MLFKQFLFSYFFSPALFYYFDFPDSWIKVQTTNFLKKLLPIVNNI